MEALSSSPSVPQSLARPLSPHLQVYRFQLTSVLSFLHRLTGIALGAGIIPVVIWLGALARGPEAYHVIKAWYSSFLGITFLLAWAFCYYFHLANGIRHLFWDAGWGYELKTVYRSGWMAVAFSCGLTLLTLGWLRL